MSSRSAVFFAQVTDEQGLKELFEKERVTAYIGFDPTASSLHVGSLVPIMSLAHLQRTGNRPIGLVGGGTGLVGDPSGKTEMRQILTRESIEANVEGLKSQLSRFIEFGGDNAIMINNADWLCEWNYVEFLRDIGRHFSVNRMLTYESVKSRLESDSGLSFIEFNYMLLQAYDFQLPGQAPRLPAANGRQRSVGQHHRRDRPPPPPGRGAALRPDLPPDNRRLRGQDG